MLHLKEESEKSNAEPVSFLRGSRSNLIRILESSTSFSLVPVKLDSSYSLNKSRVPALPKLASVALIGDELRPPVNPAGVFGIVILEFVSPVTAIDVFPAEPGSDCTRSSLPDPLFVI